MSTIQHNLDSINHELNSFETKFGRPTGSVQLLAVSKTKPIEAIEQAIEAGHRCFGENYVQEGVDKIQYFNEHYTEKNLDWHFIGPIQSNKTKLIAENFDWVHSIDREKIAKRLSDQRPSEMAPLNVLIQVNTSGEQSKSGIDPEEVLKLAQYIDALPNLKLRGLMSIPANVSQYSEQLAAFNALKDLKISLESTINSIDTLSMGMSGDMQAAVEAGSTMVRIGTAIFGARDYSNLN
ncbi:YggS family pyridoxal phosphate-dependent enzyme [Vibrio ulleungensis]|uniref:Pyridoxal phosphate homeostasis protein n=1 Tax=Vibrio ulleungensis TaxID=2807619 RepID=A0ABS2HP29_9VIBR|nr:YggS family pyridoxal phosphate-dependent enzyme [Vibrio ulleungensis]MBM7037943.1 YggS family pyridoxal phosphate-dependent enzyme [Vibrio ulleungensis]